MSDAVATNKNPTTVRLLVVDDEPDLRELYGDRLELEGYEILTADGGRNAIAVLKTASPPVDLVMTDLMMAEGNGIDVANYCFDNGVTVLVASAYVDSFKNKLPKGIEILRKPFSLADLATQVAKMMAALPKTRSAS